MKKIFNINLVLLIIIIVFAACQKKQFEKSFLSPVIKDYYDSGELAYKKYVIMNKELHIVFYRNGQKTFIGYGKNGKLDGFSKEYLSNGDLLWEGYYCNNKRIYPHEDSMSFENAEFRIEPQLPDTMALSGDTLYFSIISPYHFDDFLTFVSKAYHKSYRNENKYSLFLIDSIPSGYVRIGVKSYRPPYATKLIDSVYFINDKN